MLRKLFCGLMAAGMLLATSCQQQELTPSLGEEAVVTFNVGTPEIATRAYSDGLTATKLQYAVYDADGRILIDLTKTDDDLTNKTATVSFKLKTGSQYTVLFWAAAEDAPYDVDFSTEFGAANMTVKYDEAVSNAENRDAFYAHHTFVAERAMSLDVILKRPFAQLNIATADYEAAKEAGYVPTHSFVTVSNVYSQLNFAKGTVAGPQEVTFDYAAIGQKEFHVAGYEYLAMNYLLVAADKETMEVTFGCTDDVNNAAAAESYVGHTIGSVPVQRNYRTNIFGNLLTSDVDIHVSIDNFYEDEEYAVFEAFEKGGVATLTQNMELAGPLFVRKGVKAVLDLNGYSLKNNIDNKDTDVIIVEEGAELTINGEGTIEAVSGNDGYAVISEGAVIINGGTFKSGVDANGEPNAVIYARGNGKVFVNGGQFLNDNALKFVLNKKDADRATTTIEVRGGTFYNFNPENNAAEGPETNFVAEGHIVLVDGDAYTVVSGARVATADEFKEAAANKAMDYIFVTADLDFGTSSVNLSTQKTILGNGYNFIAGGKTTKAYGLIVSANTQICDLVMNGGGGIAVINGAVVDIYDVVLKTTYSHSGRHMFYVSGSTLNVYTGEFEVLRTGSYYFSMENNAKANVMGGTFEDMMASNQAPVYTATGAQLEITGGKFQVATSNYKFDPTAYVPAGYKVERVGDYMEVSAE